MIVIDRLSQMELEMKKCESSGVSKGELLELEDSPLLMRRLSHLNAANFLLVRQHLKS